MWSKLKIISQLACLLTDWLAATEFALIRTCFYKNKELVSEITRLKLEMKDMEIALEKERINNERAIEVSYLDRTHIQNDMTK